MRLSSTVLLALPMLIGGFVQFVVSQYYQKFATDALLLDSAIVGGIFFVSRITDAILDPVCGYLSDRFQSRRLFIAVGVMMLSAGTILAFLPGVSSPDATQVLDLPSLRPGFTQYALAGAGIFVVYLGVTMVYIPHYAWLAELSHREPKLPFFASRAITENFGIICGGFSLGLLVPYQTKGGVELLSLMAAMVLALALLALLPLFIYRRREINRKIGVHTFISAARALGKNRRFGLVAAMSFFNQFAATTLLAVSLYYTEHVLRRKELGSSLAIVFLLSATAFIPVWSALTRRFDRYRLWTCALVVIIAVFPTLFFAQVGHFWYLTVFAVLVGGAAGAVILFVPQEISELTRNSQEDAGLYFAAFTFVNKSAMAAAPLVIGFSLKIVSYVPHAPPEAARSMIVFLFAGLPAIAFIVSAVLLRFYRLPAPTPRSA